MLNVHVVDIHQGGSQSFYVSMADHIHVALRVPHLKLQSARYMVIRAALMCCHAHQRYIIGKQSIAVCNHCLQTLPAQSDAQPGVTPPCT